MKKKKKGRAKPLNNMGMAFIGIILILNLIGVGYGYWVNDMKINGVVSTGFIDPAFKRCEIMDEDSGETSEESIKATTDVRIIGQNGMDEGKGKKTGKGKKMCINIEDGYPGYSVRIKYAVTNLGTLPVECDVAGVSDPFISVEHVKQISTIKGNGDVEEGIIKITLGEVTENKNYGLSFDLVFKQSDRG